MSSRNLHIGDPLGPDPHFLDRVLNDLAPHDPAGQRRLRPSRRGLLRLGSGLVATTMLPACDAANVKQNLKLIILLFQAGKKIYDLTHPISGNTLLVNDSDKTVRLEALFTLQEAFPSGAEADAYSPEAPWSVPPGDSSFSFGDLHANNVGEHLIQMNLGGTSYETDPFTVR